MPSALEPVEGVAEVLENGRTWLVTTPENALAVLDRLGAAAGGMSTLMLFRGQQDFRWNLESSFARNAKAVFGAAPGELLNQRVASCGHLVRFLYGALLCKFGTLVRPVTELHELREAFPDLDPWYELLRDLQQHPEHDRCALKGTPLLDWSDVPLTALWFATSSEGEASDGAVFAWECEASGKVQSTRSLEELFDRMDKHNWEKGPIPGNPMLYAPSQRVAHPRAVAQKAQYVAHVDLRWPVDYTWSKIEQQSRRRVFVKLRIPASIKQGCRQLLAKRGVTSESLAL